MIRRYKMLLALSRTGQKSEELYAKAVAELEIQEMKCPYCKIAGACKRHGKYIRYILEWGKGEKVCSPLEVVRIRCQCCHKTHSFLPPFVIPYSSYSLCFVLQVVQCYYRGNDTILQICEKYDISESMLYRWKYVFEECCEDWVKMLKSVAEGSENTREQRMIQEMEEMAGFVSFIDLDNSFLNNYQVLFQRSFMERTD